MPAASSHEMAPSNEFEGRPLMFEDGARQAGARSYPLRYIVVASALCAAAFVACVPLFRSSPETVRSRADDTINAQLVHLRHKQLHEPGKQAITSLKNCSGAGAGCLDTQCCMDPGHQCFTKNKWWAQCMTECTPGPNPLDQVSPSAWECKALGKKVAGEPHECAESFGENCAEKQCCKGVGMQCFQKNDGWAACKPACTPGADLTESNSDPWTCKTLGPKKMGAAPWVKKTCSASGDDCSQTSCCKDAGLQCYKQNDFWAQCKATCKPGEKPNSWDEPWDCTELGSRNPGYADDVTSAKGIVAPWVPEKCTGAYDDCVASGCCYGVDKQCYTKNKYYGVCKSSCSTDPDPYDGNSTWECNTVGPRGWGLALKGYPSVYCISLYMPGSYEGPLLQAHLDMNAGIFTCDGYDVFAAEPDTMKSKDGSIEVKAIQIPKINVGVSQDGTAGNAKLFMAVWDKVIAGGRFRYYDWTVKVDPDAVLLAWRLREHMKPHIGEKVYVVNCNKFPSSPNFPMMYGALEIFSHPAMVEYAQSSWRCGQELDWKAWGEDYFMTHCMDYIGVGRIGDFGVLGDNVCTGANCGDGWTAAYHPFKDIGTWSDCWGTATAK